MGKKKKQNRKNPKPDVKPLDVLKETSSMVDSLGNMLDECQKHTASLRANLDIVAKLEPGVLAVAGFQMLCAGDSVIAAERTLARTATHWQNVIDNRNTAD